MSLANTGQRIIAALLDLVVIGIYVWLVRIILSSVFNTVLFDGFTFLSLFLVYLPATFYIPVSEYLWNGRTVGKYLMKMRVLNISGSAASMGDIILRWMLRTIDIKIGFILFFFLPESATTERQEQFMIFVYVFWVIPLPIVGIISMLVTKNNQRVGDLVANTVVIHGKRLISLEDTILKSTEEDYVPRFTNVLQLSDKDIYIIKNVLDNVEKSKNHKLVNDLATKARVVLKIEEKMPPKAMLQTLLKDYNHLAKKKDEVL